MTTATTQRAIQLIGPDQLRLNPAKAIPEPGDYQVLARVEVTGLCFSDLKLLKQFHGHVRKSEIVDGLSRGLLADMPVAVLGAIVFLIGVDLVDVLGLRRIWQERRGEAIIAMITAAVVCAIGVEEGIILAIVMSAIWLIQRQYAPDSFVIKQAADAPVFGSAKPGAQTMPGLIVFRYDSELFYANANRFVDAVEAVFSAAPDPVRWLVLDCSSVTDIDYSAAISVRGLIDYVHAHRAHFGIMGADPALLHSMRTLGLTEDFTQDRVFADFDEVVAAYQQDAHG